MAQRCAQWERRTPHRLRRVSGAQVAFKQGGVMAMSLTRDFKQTVVERVRRDPAPQW
jgi:hypothetical protein